MFQGWSVLTDSTDIFQVRKADYYRDRADLWSSKCSSLCFQYSDFLWPSPVQLYQIISVSKAGAGPSDDQL